MPGETAGIRRRAPPTAHPNDVTSIDLLRIRRGMVKGSRAEIKCDACDGSGSLPVREPELGRKIYPGRCTKCAGKGPDPQARVSTSGASVRSHFDAALRNGCQSETPVKIVAGSQLKTRAGRKKGA